MINIYLLAHFVEESEMRLNTPFVTIIVVAVAIIAVVIGTFIAPVTQVIAIAPLIVGVWLIILGWTTSQPNVAGLFSTPAVSTFWGGIMTSSALTYLVVTASSDVRITLLVLIIGITLTVSLARYVELKQISSAIKADSA